jgi:hypothetical protein|tara:strand:+ start:3428 stop:3613 length:186 start_codon:yes stop_codon:yes gene_type:complete
LFKASISGAHSCCENDECGGICHAEEISTGEAEKGNGFLLKKGFWAIERNEKLAVFGCGFP